MADHPRHDLSSPEEWDDAALAAAVRDLGASLDYPPTPDLATSVRRRLAVQPPPNTQWPRRWFDWRGDLGPRRAVATAALAFLFFVVLVVALIPSVRETVAGWFGVSGVRIVFVDETPTPAATASPDHATPAATPITLSIGSDLLLGQSMTLAEARAIVDFPIIAPPTALFGEPDEVYMRQLPDGPMVALLYYPRPGLPATAETGVGLLLVQFEAAPGSLLQTKEVSSANEVRVTQVGDRDGLWLGGAHYLLIAPDPVARAAGNVLLWERDGVTFRLESNLDPGQVVVVAESLIPLPGATPAP